MMTATRIYDDDDYNNNNNNLITSHTTNNPRFSKLYKRNSENIKISDLYT